MLGENSSMPRWLPMALTLAAFACAGLFAVFDDLATRHWLGLAFAELLGWGLLAWAVEAFRDGRVRGRRKTILRAEHPSAFRFIVWVKFILPGVAMVFAGAWFVTRGP